MAEAETGLVLPQAREPLGPPAAGRGRGSSPRTFKAVQPCRHLTSDFQPPGQTESAHCSKSSGLWCFIKAAPRN